MNQLPTHSIDEAIAILLAGGVGVMPTDTVYGIVARAYDEQATTRLYTLKQRDHKPGTVIAASVEQLRELGIPEQYLTKVEHLWPNPLSIVMPHTLTYLHQERGDQPFRVVDHEGIRRILEQTGPLVTSSANQPGEPPATIIDEAQAYFGDGVDFYVDGGDLSGRAPSTIARLTEGGLEVLRQGAVTI